MPYQSLPKFGAQQLATLPISDPGIGGINLKDLEYELDASQSPDMLNMMYRNGSFSKRYGQEQYKALTSIHAIAYYKDYMIIHAGTSVYRDDLHGGESVIATISNKKGFFINFNRNLYYICDGHLYEYDGTTWGDTDPYIPDFIINRSPDPSVVGSSAGDYVDSLNLLVGSWKNTFNSDGTSKVYHLNEGNLDATLPRVWFNTDDNEILSTGTVYEGVTYSWTYDKDAGTVTFNVAPPEARNFVIIQMFKESTSNKDELLKCQCHAVFGGNSNSRLFLAGNGSSTLYYSDVFAANYFPADCYMTFGNGEEDITGFGTQYNVLIIFKPREMYSLSYYIQSSSTTEEDNDIGRGAFSSQLVNSRVGCDCPNSIQLINNQLVWLSSIEGVCTLTSTYVLDERNVRPISRNINRTNNLNVPGILDWDNLDDVVSTDYDQRYFLVNPHTGQAFMWDYGNTPYSNTGQIEKDARRLAWFLFDNFHAYQYCKVNTALYYFKDSGICKLNATFNDFGSAIKAHYMTPLFQFFTSAGWNTSRTAVEYLKNVMNIYIQCRGDTASIIKMKYITQDNHDGIEEPYDLEVDGESTLWDNFSWDNFVWFSVSSAKVFRRKCALKRNQMTGFYFSNEDVSRDMSISHISVTYNLVHRIK